MIESNELLLYTFVYVLSLFLVAFIAEKVFPKKPKLINNPYVYSLTLAVYCTSWTFYGSVGQAATHGIDFITIYIGPTLIIFTWWFLLRKIIRISESYNINSIADFVSFRYGKSKAIGIIVTIVCFFGIIPYIALQLKAMNETASILTGIASHSSPYFYTDTSFYVALLIGVLGAIFGTIHFGEQRKHPGITSVIAYESLFKLIIFLTAGIIITFVIFDGFSDILSQMSNSPYQIISDKYLKLITVSDSSGGASNWFAMIFMSMMAVMFLPRQFHMTVVENYDETHIRKMMYLFPLYLFLINIFVIPIAFAGILTFNNTGNPDYYSLSVLVHHKYHFLSILVYIGGIAASTGMVFISSISLANMFINNILLPISVKILVTKNIGNSLLHFKRLSIITVMIAGYFYYYAIGESFSLVSIGLASFAAICIFSPQILFGLFWKRANAKGAFYGILVGFFAWFYTTIIPYATMANLIPDSIMKEGLFGLGILRPTQLFGITGLDFWAHSLFWILLLNITVFVIVSIISKTNHTEEETANICLNILKIKDISMKKKIISGISVDHFLHILTNFFGKTYANERVYGFIESLGKSEKELTAFDLADLKVYTEKCLAEAVGPGASKLIIDSYLKMIGTGEEQVMDIFHDLVSYGAGESKETLIKRMSELNVLLGISKIFAHQDNLQYKLNQVMKLLKETFKFDEIIIREKDEEKLFIIANTGDISKSPLNNFRVISPDNSYINKTVHERKQFAVNDISKIQLNRYSAFLKDNGVIAFCHTPLLVGDEMLGVISTFSRLHKDIYTTEFMDILQTIANQIASLMHNQRQNEELLKMNAITKEMEIAESIMTILLPEKSPNIDTLDISGSCIPSKYVGGDYYDFFIPKEGIVDFVIADVSGHNVASALIMTEFRSLLKSIIASHPEISPAEVVKKLNHEIANDLQKLEFIITLFYMRMDLKEQTITYTNAGHNYPVILQKDTLIELKGGGPLFGLLADIDYDEFKVPYEKGDSIYLYTDGVTETENEKNVQFGTNKLYRLLGNLKDKTAMETVNQINEELIFFRRKAPQSDDITMISIKVTGEK